MMKDEDSKRGRSSPTSSINFSKLDDRALWNYIGHHNIQKVRQNASPQELAQACSRHFEKWEVDEEHVLQNFSLALTDSSHGGREIRAPWAGSVKKRARDEFVPHRRGGSGGAAAFSRGACSPRVQAPSFSPGDLVAAKTGTTDEWILVRVLRYYGDPTDSYEVLDVDPEKPKELVVDSGNVRSLNEKVDSLNRGEQVLAVFPETTSFYRAKVSRLVKRGATEVFVQFEDDEENGATPHRKVPAKHVLSTNDDDRDP